MIVAATGAVLVQSGAPPAAGSPRFATARTVADRTLTTPPVDGPERPVTIDGAAYPNPLRLADGDPVTTPAEWEGHRRAELLAEFRQNVYGQGLPDSRPRRPSRSRSTDFPGATRKVVKITVTGP